MAGSIRFPGDCNHGNAIHLANSALGRIALRAGDRDGARKFLAASIDSKGSPQMRSFGPNMILADEMLAAGERDAVLVYFQGCRAFWVGDFGQLEKWESQVREGKRPDFGSNLHYLT